MVLEVIEQVAGMVGSMLEFPLAGMLGRLLPAGGSEAGQQVRMHFYDWTVCLCAVERRICDVKRRRVAFAV